MIHKQITGIKESLIRLFSSLVKYLGNVLFVSMNGIPNSSNKISPSNKYSVDKKNKLSTETTK